jgi:uncharacterized protein (DUF1697 family)
MPRYIALLRGINVGGSTMMKMDELKAVFNGLGFVNVVSYINSGNIAFDADDASEEFIEQGIERQFGRHVDVMLRERADIERVIAANPFAGQYESHKQMHVLFLKEPLLDDKARLLAETDFGEERFIAVGRELYGLLPAGVAESLFSKKAVLEKKPKALYTGRNIRTVERLARL